MDAAAVAVFRNGDYLLTTDNKVKRCLADGSGTCTTVAGQGAGVYKREFDFKEIPWSFSE